MRLLFDMDKKDYDPEGTKTFRPSVRGVILRDGKLALVRSLKYDYYKFPGGGTDEGESHTDTLVREVREETGLNVLPESVREYGYVYRAQKGKTEDVFVQENFYYFCEVSESLSDVSLDDYEAEEEFTLEFASPRFAAEVNRTHKHGEKDASGNFAVMNERDTRVMEMLAEELGL
ncbi:MAG: NUDIX domain-containing protein [Ruminiclostridium sp.]|nr:NUDIX domain-containing protein [Ruminiclostridium sp.]